MPALLAAMASGDDAEAERLAASTPTSSWRCADSLPLRLAFKAVCQLHYMDLLRLAARYFESRWLGTTTLPGWGDLMQTRSREEAALFGVQLAGWRLFCKEHGFPPDLFWDVLPGKPSLRLMEMIVTHDAEFIRGCDIGTTPEGVAAELQKLIEQQEVRLNGGSKP